MFIINDSTKNDVLFSTEAGKRSRGLIERNYTTHPVGYYANIPAAAIDMPTLSRDTRIEIVKYRKAQKATNRDIRRTRGPHGGIIPSLDQNGIGYCWIHSGTMAIIMRRAQMNQPYVSLSAFGPGCLMKNYRDEGGWGADGVQWLSENGVPAESYWPQRSMSRSNDTPEMRANAKLFRIQEGWVDFQTPVWSRSMTYDQQKTWLALGGLIVADFNWWVHSVLLWDLDIVDGEECPTGINSWGDSWGDIGEFTLQGERAIMNGGVGVRTATPSID